MSTDSTHTSLTPPDPDTTTMPTPPKASLKRRGWLDWINSSLVAAALIGLIVIFTVASPYFFTSLNWYHILQAVAVVAVLTIGQAFVIITAGIDLSQGSVIGLAGVVSALIMSSGHPVWQGLLAGLLIGAVVGAINGILVVMAQLPPFIATLATLSIAEGAALIATGGQPVFNLPASFTNFGQFGLGILPYTALVAIALAIIFHLLLAYTRFGRFTYAVGSNVVAARLSGLKVGRQLFLVYLLSGILSAIGGMLLTAYVSSALPTGGANYELNSIAAVVIGGGSLFGGEGTIWGSMLGALLMAVLSNGTQLLGVSTYWQEVLLGLVVVIAVYVDHFRRRVSV